MKEVSNYDVMMAYKDVSASPEGQVVLADLMHRFAFTRTSTFVPGETDYTMFHEGQRSVMVHIGKMVEGNPADLTDPDAQHGEM